MEFDLNLNDHSDCCVENGLEGREVLRVIHVSTSTRYGDLCKLEGTHVTCSQLSPYSSPLASRPPTPNPRWMLWMFPMGEEWKELIQDGWENITSVSLY